MIVLAGADLVLPDRIRAGSLLIDGDRIVALEPGRTARPSGATVIDAEGGFVVPGFVDVHVHGVERYDTHGGPGALAAIASRLPRYGVTAFCPTTVACAPPDLQRVLHDVRTMRTAPPSDHARVLQAHLESNFINPDYRGAQPLACLRHAGPGALDAEFTGRAVLDVIAAWRADVGIITLAPELPGGLDLVRQLADAGHHVSLGHSAATFEQAMAAFDAGARQATHLFNRMPPLLHRAPGLVGAVLAREDVVAELICDGYHVHPAVGRMAIATKGTAGIMAITDGTAGAGLLPGATAQLGAETIRVGEQAALLPDGTLAGSTLTMDRAFQTIVSKMGLSVVEAVHLCCTTPARQMNMNGFGVLAEGRVADVVVLDRMLRVQRTFIAGREVYRSGATA